MTDNSFTLHTIVTLCNNCPHFESNADWTRCKVNGNELTSVIKAHETVTPIPDSCPYVTTINEHKDFFNAINENAGGYNA